MFTASALCQQNKDFFGYTVFEFNFAGIKVRFVTEKDALRIVEEARRKVKESRPTVKGSSPAQQRKGEICRKKHCQLARNGGFCSNITCSTGCGYYRVKLSPVA